VTNLTIGAALVAAFGLLIWQLVRQTAKSGEQAVREAANLEALEALRNASEVDKNIDGMSRADLERLLQDDERSD
jgi:hypothetical protein